MSEQIGERGAMLHEKSNIVLIGMPGSGKSTVGKALADKLKRDFVDTDSIIREMEGIDLRDIVEKYGMAVFLKRQELHLLNLKVKDNIIATGGSVIYSPNLMDYFKKDGIIVFLKQDYEELRLRLEPGRRLARNREQSFMDLYNERLPIYSKFSDITIECSDKKVEQLVNHIADKCGLL